MKLSCSQAHFILTAVQLEPYHDVSEVGTSNSVCIIKKTDSKTKCPLFFFPSPKLNTAHSYLLWVLQHGGLEQGCFGPSDWLGRGSPAQKAPVPQAPAQLQGQRWGRHVSLSPGLEHGTGDRGRVGLPVPWSLMKGWCQRLGRRRGSKCCQGES